jgi:hypothetical protein
MPSAFDIIPKRKRVIVFKMGKLWIFKHFFNDKELFKALADYYNKDQYRLSIGARSNVLDLLGRNGFDCDLVEDLKCCVVQLPKSSKYVQILKSFCGH